MITHQKGNIFASTAQTLVNPVNLVGVMGKGLALEFKEKYPPMFDQYKRLCDQKKFKIGMLHLWKGHPKWVLNFPTKLDWRDLSGPEIVEAGLFKFVNTFKEKGINSAAFPRLGCGEGGLDWEDVVKPMMEEYLGKLPVHIEIYSLD